MIKNWAPLTEDIKALMRTMRGDAPNVMKAFSGLAQAASAPQAIDGKTKELIALGISVAIRCDDCIGFHVRRRSITAQRARRSSRPSAWRSTWAPGHR